MRLTESKTYFVGNGGCIMDDAGNGVDEPLKALVVDNVFEQDGCLWGRSGNDLVELFYLAEDEDELESIVSGYREVFWGDGSLAFFVEGYLFCQMPS